MKNSTGEVVQAMPITKTTYVGTPSNQAPNGGTVHVSDAGDVTFHYATGDITITTGAAMDFQASDDCTGITASVPVIIT